MTSLAILNQIEILEEILEHPAWHGKLSGLQSERLLKLWNQPYHYILRAGEDSAPNKVDYYVSFLRPDFTIEHRPFQITVTPEGWYAENGGFIGPLKAEVSIDMVLHTMMHCNSEEIVPLVKMK